MGLLQAKFRFAGSPVQMMGRGNDISVTTLLAPSTTQGKMRIHCLSGYISTLFLCEYCDHGGELLLLDTGMPRDIDRVRFFVEEVLGKEYKNEGHPCKMEAALKTVLSSHCHVDHVGAAWAYNDLGIDTAVADGFEAYYAGVGGRMQQAIDAGLSLLFAHRLGRALENPLQPLIAKRELNPHLRLRDGSAVPNFPDWVAIACPGHTCHMNMFYHPELEVLYGADFFVAHKNEFRAPVPVDVDFAYDHTLHRLSKLPVRYVLLAHGGIVDCEDVGGWTSILSDVGAHRQKEDRNATLKLIRRFLIGYSPEPKGFDRGRLPRGPLPTTFENPPPLYVLK